MAKAETKFSALDGIAAAAGPGLIGGVIVGLTTAKAIALVHGTPLIAVNHLEAHALTPRLTAGLAVSLLPVPCLRRAYADRRGLGVGNYARIGTTLDDAIGEAFDKVAKMLGLPYPGGPQVEIAARTGDAARFNLPRADARTARREFLAVGPEDRDAAWKPKSSAPLTHRTSSDLCASFQQAVLDLDRRPRCAPGLRCSSERYGAPTRAGRRRRRRGQPGDPRRAAGRRGEGGIALMLPPPDFAPITAR